MHHVVCFRLLSFFQLRMLSSTLSSISEFNTIHMHSGTFSTIRLSMPLILSSYGKDEKVECCIMTILKPSSLIKLHDSFFLLKER